ncbi:hypothetical protein T12_477, partial [Trichinella patagoniensis]
LYVRPFAFGAPTGGNAPCLNMVGTLSTISSHYKIEKQDSGNVLPIHCKEKQNRNAQSANCLPVTKSKHGILEGLKKLQWNNIRKGEDTVPFDVSSKYFCERHVSDHNREEIDKKRERGKPLIEKTTMSPELEIKEKEDEFWKFTQLSLRLQEVEVEKRGEYRV